MTKNERIANLAELNEMLIAEYKAVTKEKAEWIELTLDLIDTQYPSNEDKLKIINNTLSLLAKERAKV